MASFNSARARIAQILAAALSAAALVLAGAGFDAASAATRRFRIEPPEIVVDEPAWLCLERGGPPSRVQVEGVEMPTMDRLPDGTGARHRVELDWPGTGTLELNQSVARSRADESTASAGSPGLRPGVYRVSAEGFEPETLRVREASPAERRDYALLRRVRFHCQAGDSARAGRLLRDFLAQSRNPSAIVAARLELLSVLPYTEYADRPKLWLAEWVARHHQNCVVGVGIEAWLSVVTPQEGRAALQELAFAYVGTRASVVAQELLRRGSATANASALRAGND